MDDLEAYAVPIHASLNRPMLVLGGERQLVLMLGVVAGIFIFSLAQLWAAVVGIVIWMVGQYFLARAAAYDAQLSKVGPRHLKYQKYYLSSATPFSAIREIKSCTR